MESEEYYELKSRMGKKPKPETPSVKDQLRSMGRFFEIDPKKVGYYIRQLELSGKI